ncbi:hypothetical protein [Zhihengliuella flava]|uniref:Uncharacterized protein n=1 Tax=Zhihengliuella flava TaxID=1285193 RepID=A0A931GHH1_9MICC|nr:hypothetical protein [Zhihengliuella flava]MBG6083241.1 hypothetical protein [Zhihengliuella flava]
MFSPAGRLPDAWKSPVTVLRSGGRDDKGNPLEDQEIPRGRLLVAPRATNDPVDRSDVADVTAVLYDEDTTFRYYSTDRIRIDAPNRMAGTWQVDGRPGEWPAGSEVGLVMG